VYTRLTFLLGFLLLAVGTGGYVLSDRVSLTALIPSVFGVLVLGLNAFSSHARLGSAARVCLLVVTTFGVVLPQRGLLGFFRSILASEFHFRMVTLSQAAMGILCFAVLVATLLHIGSLRKASLRGPRRPL